MMLWIFRKKQAALLLILVVPALAVAQPGLRHIDKIEGPDACGECHKDEVIVWKETHHYRSFYEMPRKEEAREIADKMGIKRIKRESDCMNCHFTNHQEEGTTKPFAGVSCESCHSAASEWIKVHNDFGGKDVKPEDETAEHRQERYRKIKEAGMLRPGNIYGVAQNCFQCHTVPNEKLVNVGGHKAGSDFELVSWSQGEIRHNFHRSASGEENISSQGKRLRMLYVMGRALDLEYSLRGVAKATVKAEYAVTMAKRVKRAIAWLEEIQQAAAVPEIAEMIAAGNNAALKLNNEAELLQAADKVAEAARRLAANYDGEAWSALDGLLPKSEDYKGKPAK